MASFELLSSTTKARYASRRYENLDVGVRFDYPGATTAVSLCSLA